MVIGGIMVSGWPNLDSELFAIFFTKEGSFSMHYNENTHASGF